MLANNVFNASKYSRSLRNDSQYREGPIMHGIRQ